MSPEAGTEAEAGETLLTGLLAGSSSVTIVTQAKLTCLGDVSWALLLQLAIKQPMPHSHAHRPIGWRQLLS